MVKTSNPMEFFESLPEWLRAKIGDHCLSFTISVDFAAVDGVHLTTVRAITEGGAIVADASGRIPTTVDTVKMSAPEA